MTFMFPYLHVGHTEPLEEKDKTGICISRASAVLTQMKWKVRKGKTPADHTAAELETELKRKWERKKESYANDQRPL